MTTTRSRAIRYVAIKFGVFAVVSLTMLVLLYNTMVRPVSNNSNRYMADFTDVSGLKVGDDVRIAGVRVGAVDSIQVVGDSALVGIEVGPGHPLSDTMGLVLRYQNLVGQKYLAIVPGKQGGTPLAPGSVIPFARTSPGFNLTSLLNGFRPLFQVLRPQDVNKLSESIIQVLQGEGGTVSGLLQETTQLTNYLADRDHLFHQVAMNLVPVLGEISGNGQQLADSVHQLSELTAGLAANRGTIMSSIDSMAELLDRVETTVTELRQPLTRDIAVLQQVLHLYATTKDQYGAAPGQFAKVLEVLGRITSYQSAANIYYCTITVIAGGAKVPTDPPGSKYSKVCK